METIWIKNPRNLITYYDSFSVYTNNNPYNAFIRSLLICCFIFTMFKRYKWSYITLLLILVTTIIGYIKDKEIVDNTIPCRASTINNPMGNLLPFSTDPLLKACVEDDKDRTDKLFHGHYRNQNDHINEAIMRDFITMPVTSIVDDRQQFSEFLMSGYDDPFKTCKGDDFQCEKYRDIRYTF